MPDFDISMLLVATAILFFTLGLQASVFYMSVKRNVIRKRYLKENAPGLRREAIMINGVIIWPTKVNCNDVALEAANKFHSELLYIIAHEDYLIAFDSTISRPKVHLPCPCSERNTKLG